MFWTIFSYALAATLGALTGIIAVDIVCVVVREIIKG